MISCKSIFEKLAENNYRHLRLLFLAIIYAVPIILGFYYLSHYVVNIPYWDQWDKIVKYSIEWHSGTFHYSNLLEVHNDSRPVIRNIVELFVSVLTALNIKIMYCVGYILFLTCILFIFYFIKRDIGLDFLTLALLTPVVFYALNPYFLVIWTIEYPLIILTALASLYLLFESKRSDPCFFFAIGMGVLCTFSFAAGLSIWFAGFVQLLLQKMHRKWEKVIIWMVSAASIFYVYFVLLGLKTEGLHGAGAYASFIETTIRYPLNKFLCYMGTLGSEVIHDSQVALFFGLIIFFITIALIYVNREFLELDRYSKWYGLLAFGMLTSLEVTLTRSGDVGYLGSAETLFFIPDIRHSLAIFLPIICIYILAIIYLKESVTQEKINDKKSNDFKFYIQEREHKNLFLVGIIFMLLLSSVVLHTMPGISMMKTNYDQQIINQYYVQNYATVADEKFKAVLPDPLLAKSRAAKLQQYNLSIFANQDPEPHFLRFYWLDPDIKSASGGGALEAAFYRKDPNLVIGSESIPAIFEHPQGPTGTTVVYENIKMHNNSHLEFSVGLDENIWSKPESDGVTFEIYLHDSATNTTHKIFSQMLDPVHSLDDRGWHHFELSLDEYREETVSVQFVTRPNGNASYDWAWWGDPKMIW
jgi:hypothetical protein